MRKLLTYGVIAVIAITVLYVVGGSFVFNRVLNRILVVGSGSDIAAEGQPSETPYDLAYRGDPKVAFGFDFQDVMVASDIGDLPAWLIPPAGAAKDIWAIFMHGIAGYREGGYRYLPALRETGFPTLMITYRNDPGAPKSAEGVYSFGLAEWPDLDAAVGYALDHGATRVIIAADSMGGGVLGQFLMHSQQTDSVAAILMDAPALDFPAVAAGMGNAVGFPLAPLVSAIATRMFAFQHSVNLADAVVLRVLADFGGPMMLVHGSGDRIVPVSVSEHLLAMRYGTTMFLRTHADHLQSRAADSARYDLMLRQFLAGL